jgi:methyl-accepting chemotaxis protein
MVSSLKASDPKRNVLLFVSIIFLSLLGMGIYTARLIKNVSVSGTGGQAVTGRQSIISDLEPSFVSLSTHRRITFQLLIEKDRINSFRQELDLAKAAILSRYGEYETAMPESDAKNLLLGDALQTAKKYMDVIDNEYIPLLRANNMAPAERVLRERLEPLWAEYSRTLAQAAAAARDDKTGAETALRKKLVSGAVAMAGLLTALLAFIGIVMLKLAGSGGSGIGALADSAERMSVGEIVPGLLAAENSNDDKGRLQNALLRINEYHAALEQSAKKIACGDYESQIEVASQEDRLGLAMLKLTQGIRAAQEELRRNNMDIALYLGEYFNIMNELSLGNLSVNVNIATENELLKQLSLSTNKFLASISEVSKCAERIARGDLTVKVPVRSDRDELGIALELMVTCFHAFTLEVKQQADQLAIASQGLSQITQQSSQMITQLSMTSTQISASTSSVAQSSQNASLLSQSVEDASRQGKELIGRLVEKIRMVKAAEDTSGEAMNNLSSRSAQIGEIVGVITKIADQTNLLSLNAAIEAARAGEAGHGFAVVADEVRKLAESSANSAQEISRIIKEVQDETKNAVLSSRGGRKEIDEGIELTDQSNERFAVIVSQIEGMNKQIEVIAAAAEETAASAEESAAATEEQTAAIEEVTNNVSHVSDMACVLSKAVNVFKL